MKSTTNVNLNVQLPNYSTVIYAVQGDVMSREISATLLDGSSPFEPPWGADGVIRYRKPDGTVGMYDTMEDGTTPAVTVTGNVATILLAEQMLTVVGEVMAQLSFYSADSERLSTFTFKVVVEENPYTDEAFESTDYYSVLTADIASILAVVENMPAPATDLPLMDGTAAIGVKGEFARSDHVHPTDTTRASTTSVQGLEQNVQKIEQGVKGKRILFIGDSYNGVTTDKWTDIAIDILGLSDSAVLTQGSYCFAGSNTWLSLLQNETFTDEETITDIAIVGGANDAWSTLANIPQAISDFNDYIVQRFTGLKGVWLGFAGNTYAGGTQLTNMRAAMRHYISSAKTLGWHYMHGIESTLFNVSYMQKIGADDYIHPNLDGVSALGKNVAQCILTGYCDNYNEMSSITFTRASGMGSGTFVMSQNVNNNMLYVSMGDIAFTNSSQASSVVTIATCDEMKNMLRPYTFINVYVTSGSTGFTAVMTFTNYTTLTLILPQSIGANVGFTVHGFTQMFDMVVS